MGIAVAGPEGEGAKRVKELFASPSPVLMAEREWRTTDPPLSAAERKEMIEYFRRESCMLRELMDNPGTYRMPEHIYRGEAAGWLDDHLACSPSGRALKNRIRAVVVATEGLVLDKMRSNGGRARIINMGCGTGRDTLLMMKKNPRWSDRVRVECVDLDMEALDSGREFARAMEISNVDFVEANILSLTRREEFDVGLLVGVLCGIPASRCVAILKKIKPYFKKGGILVASNVTTAMIDQDPLVSYILEEFVGWRLVYKTPQQLRHIFERAGYEWKGCFLDEPHRFHCMGMGAVL